MRLVLEGDIVKFEPDFKDFEVQYFKNQYYNSTF